MLKLPTTLASAKPGKFLCTSVDAEGVCWTRMKSLGLCEGREFELVSKGDPMIVRVSGARIGLSRNLASCVSIVESQQESVSEFQDAPSTN